MGRNLKNTKNHAEKHGKGTAERRGNFSEKDLWRSAGRLFTQALFRVFPRFLFRVFRVISGPSQSRKLLFTGIALPTRRRNNFLTFLPHSNRMFVGVV
jgi:hypothetical protein